MNRGLPENVLDRGNDMIKDPEVRENNRLRELQIGLGQKFQVQFELVGEQRSDHEDEKPY